MSARRLITLLCLLLTVDTAPALADCQVAGGFQTYYVLGREDQTYEFFVAVDVGEGGANPINQMAIESVVTLTATIDGQVIHYDHWEDGFDPDPFNPGPSSGTYNLNRGQTLTLASDNPVAASPINQPVPTSPRGFAFRYDGGDRVVSIGGPVSIVHSMWPLNYALIGESLEIYPRKVNSDNYSFVVPIGRDKFDGAAGFFAPFKYVEVNIQAYEDNTAVQLNNGTATVAFTLNEGESYSSRGFINALTAPSIIVNTGTVINASKPVQAVMLTAGAGQFGSRFFTLLPSVLWSRDYVAPFIGPPTASNRPANLYLFNPSTAPAMVTGYDSTIPGGASFSIPAQTVVAWSQPTAMAHLLPAGSSARVTSTSTPIWGIVAVDRGSATDWGFTLLPSIFLTDNLIVSWSPGADDQVLPPGPDANVSPVWVVPTADDAIVCVDTTGNGFADVDTTGNGVNNPGNADYTADGIVDAGCYQVSLMTSPIGLKIYDTFDRSNAGTRIVSTAPFSASYGEDPAIASGGGTAELDLGYNILPADERFLERVVTVRARTVDATVPPTGGVVAFNVEVRTFDLAPVAPVSVRALVPNCFQYAPGSTVITYPDTTTSNQDPTIGAPGPTHRLYDWGAIIPSGTGLSSLGPDEILTFDFNANMVAACPAGRHTITLYADATYDGFRFAAQQCVDVFKTSVDLVKTVDLATAAPGDILTYTMAFRHEAAPDTLTGLVVRDRLQTELSYIAGSAQYWLSTTHGTGNWTSVGVAYNSSTRTVTFPPFTSTLSTTTNNVGQFRLQARVENEPNLELVCDQAEIISQTTPAPLPHIGSNTVCTPVTRPRLLALKQAPAEVVMGQEMTYSIVVSNSGQAPAVAATLRDVIPANATYVAESMTLDTGSGPLPLGDSALDGDAGEFTGTEIRVQLGTIAVDGSVTVTFGVRAAFAAPSQIANSAEFASAIIPPAFSNLTLTNVTRSSCTLDFTDASQSPRTQFTIGESIYMLLRDADRNSDPLTIQSTQVDLSDPTTGDGEAVIQLDEVAPNAGQFFMLTVPVTTAPDTGAPVANDGTLEVRAGSVIVTSYTDPLDGTDVCQSMATMVTNVGTPVVGPAVTVTSDVCGIDPPGGNNGIDPGDDVYFTLAIHNSGPLTVTGWPVGNPLVGTITTSTPGVTLITDTASFPSLASNSTVSSTSDFGIRLAQTVPCGTVIMITLTLSSTSVGPLSLDYMLSVDSTPDCVGCADVIITAGAPTLRDECLAIPPGSDGNIDPGDDVYLRLPVTNTSPVDVFGAPVVRGTISIVSPATGVLVLQATSDYPGLGAGLTENNMTEFAIYVDDSIACGTVIQVQLDLTGMSHGDRTITYDIPVSGPPCDSCDETIPGGGGLPVILSDTCSSGAPGNDGVVNPGELVTLSLPVVNTTAIDITGSPTLTGNLTVVAPAAGITLVQASSDYPTIPAGLASSNTTPFAIHVADWIACGTDIVLNLLFLDTSHGPQSLTFTLTVDPVAPCDVCTGIGSDPGGATFTDSCASGSPGGDGSINPGEDIDLTLRVRNTGAVAMTGTPIVGTLTVTSPIAGVTIVQGSSDYADVAAGASEPNLVPFRINVERDLPCGTQIHLQVTLTNTSLGDQTIFYTVSLAPAACEICVPPCPDPLPVADLIKAVKSSLGGPDIAFSSWTIEAMVSYAINSVETKQEIPDAYSSSPTPAPTLAADLCVAVPPQATCTVSNAVPAPPSLFFYQLVSECGGAQSRP